MAVGDALALATEAIQETGWPAFFVTGDKSPFRGTHGHLDAVDDPGALKALWRPDSLPALAVPEGRVVVDEDRFGACEAAGLDLPSTPTQTTRRGRHLFYLGSARPAVAVAPGVDLRGHGSYVVLYKPWWTDPRPLAEAPAWVSGHRRRAVELASEEAEAFMEGGRESALVSAAGQMRMIGMTANEVHAALVVMNRDRCRPQLERSAVDRIARSAATWERGEAAPVVIRRKRPEKGYWTPGGAR